MIPTANGHAPTPTPRDEIKTKILPINASKLGRVVLNDSEPGTLLQDWDIEWAQTQDVANLRHAADQLQNSSIPVGFPTETVYGLGADATRSDAVKGIYKAKQRPSDNPLIVHFASLEQLRTLLRPPQTSTASPEEIDRDPIPKIYHPLIRRFWPGPLTLLMPLPTPSPLAPEVTAGLHTFGARMPRSLIALALIRLADRPIAAPSANASTKPSPTAAEHVHFDLDGRIETILDGGCCDVGVESTVVDGLGDTPVILRPGGVSIDELRQCEGWENVQIAYKDKAESGKGKAEAPRAPGMKYRHYSPRARVVLFEAGATPPEAGALKGKRRVGIIRTKKWQRVADSDLWEVDLGTHTKDIARGLFSALRELDRQDVEEIFVEGIDETEGDIAAAVMNRLRKAAEVEVKG
ncbi:translation factor [Saccharata proteae CBS 121410]|uniref:Threonylcarbamoyl-AMP synthase n=1 Tax=Saccharata proteae CBS 121410 TaxID=1314787 RepID=A0A9P4LXT8_9PEZI|nr:translation factor [Saccharata proteae CBS 121410]